MFSNSHKSLSTFGQLLYIPLDWSFVVNTVNTCMYMWECLQSTHLYMCNNVNIIRTVARISEEGLQRCRCVYMLVGFGGHAPLGNVDAVRLLLQPF